VCRRVVLGVTDLGFVYIMCVCMCVYTEKQYGL